MAEVDNFNLDTQDILEVNFLDALQTLKFDEAGLLPAIVQDANTGQVLMMAWVNQESLRLTLSRRETWFWSRSRQVLWHKGGTSGNVQKVQKIYYDCDGDTLLILVDPAGPACHTGQTSCFYRELMR
jgi:phosphoribosyl-ATP pyrophosphohydrolase/phosphoribosyl-AMP cyclohydrolase